ncbi:MAG: GIY-YIG nuclease family protein [Sphaerochaeta sp.]|nr:GIY-YIG nuclease family protein [Sphaerochaeta sp.]MDD4301386.1 GIY-YIG nuclease family protein [Sphaerochaeta sp.]MDD4647507.1 GIY-YIG nuclease family protein [Sphaerochaeta sp.]MDY0243313.1 GIY-YIG nuclease family protein [Sphaerochaeta sp.]
MDKKHLRALYEEQKPPMGVFRLVDSSTAQEYLGVSSNIQATKNSLFFRLSVGALANYPSLQDSYDKHGPSILEFSILEELDYQEDISDYRADLEVLLSMMKQTYIHAKEIHV